MTVNCFFRSAFYLFTLILVCGHVHFSLTLQRTKYQVLTATNESLFSPLNPTTCQYPVALCSFFPIFWRKLQNKHCYFSRSYLLTWKVWRPSMSKSVILMQLEARSTRGADNDSKRLIYLEFSVYMILTYYYNPVKQEELLF